MSLPPWGGILGDALGLEGPTDGFFGGAVFLSTYSWRRLSWRHGAAEAWRQMCGDGHAQEVDTVWRRGGVDGS